MTDHHASKTQIFGVICLVLAAASVAWNSHQVTVNSRAINCQAEFTEKFNEVVRKRTALNERDRAAERFLINARANWGSDSAQAEAANVQFQMTTNATNAERAKLPLPPPVDC